MFGYSQGGDTHRCQKEPQILSQVSCSLIRGRRVTVPRKVLPGISREAPTPPTGVQQQGRREEGSWSSKTQEKRNHFWNVYSLTVKNPGSAFSLLNNKGEKNEKMGCLLIDFVPGAAELVSEALMWKGEIFPACHLAAEYRRPAMNCENIRETCHRVVCLQWSHFLLKHEEERYRDQRCTSFARSDVTQGELSGCWRCKNTSRCQKWGN